MEIIDKRIYLSSPHMSDEGFEQEYIKEAFDTNWVAPIGTNISKFEEEVTSKVGIKAAAALSSGTAAIHMALKAADVGPGDIVFCQSLTFSASANPIIYQNAIPVFIDSDEQTWNMSPVALEKAFRECENKGKKPKAVLVVHLYGLSADMDAILKICKNYNVPLIEDAAESLGTLYKGDDYFGYTGTFGEYGIFSFNGNKIITTSGGGMLVSDNEERIEKVKFWATQSRDEAKHYQHSELGYNYRMSNILAGIGRGQLRVLDERMKKKQYIYKFYRRELCGIDENGAKINEGFNGISMMPINKWNEPNCWLSCILLNSSIKPLDIIYALEKENIESRPLWKPMHMQPFFEVYDFITVCNKGSIAEDLFNKGVCLPSDTKMTKEDLHRVVGAIRRLWGR